MQTQIKFIASGANSIYGGFVAGDVLRCSLELANHFVEIGVAKFVEQEKPVEPKTRKKAKQTEA